MNNKTSYLIILLSLVAAFLAGSTVAKIKYGEGEGIGSEKTEPTIVAVPTQIPFNPQKSGKPEIKFFVMSFCPFGNQAEAGLEPVYQLLKDKVTWSPRYIVSENNGSFESLHGPAELNQNVREICAFNLGNQDKWWQFVSLVNEKCDSQNADTCWTAQAKTAGLDTAKISACEAGQKTALLRKEIAETQKYKASGSPTVVINGALYNGGRSPEDYKKAICSAFENPPEECNTVLGQESAASNGGCN